MFKINYSVNQRWYRMFQILQHLHSFCHMSVHNSGLNVRAMWLEYAKLKRILVICRTAFNWWIPVSVVTDIREVSPTHAVNLGVDWTTVAITTAKQQFCKAATWWQRRDIRAWWDWLLKRYLKTTGIHFYKQNFTRWVHFVYKYGAQAKCSVCIWSI